MEPWISPRVEREKIIWLLGQGVGQVAKLGDGSVTFLAFAFREIEGPTQQAARGASFEALHIEPELFQGVGYGRAGITHPPAFFVLQTDVHQSAHKRSRAEDHGFSGNNHPKGSADTGDPLFGIDQQFRHISLMEFNSLRVFHHCLGAELVGFLVALGAGSPH